MEILFQCLITESMVNMKIRGNERRLGAIDVEDYMVVALANR
jgi:hypothetical protein